MLFGPRSAWGLTLPEAPRGAGDKGTVRTQGQNAWSKRIPNAPVSCLGHWSQVSFQYSHDWNGYGMAQGRCSPGKPCKFACNKLKWSQKWCELRFKLLWMSKDRTIWNANLKWQNNLGYHFSSGDHLNNPFCLSFCNFRVTPFPPARLEATETATSRLRCHMPTWKLGGSQWNHVQGGI